MEWIADLHPAGGPVLGPFPLRSDALAAEQRLAAGSHLLLAPAAVKSKMACDNPGRLVLLPLMVQTRRSLFRKEILNMTAVKAPPATPVENNGKGSGVAALPAADRYG